MSFILNILAEIWDTLSLMAPYLLLGYLIAGVLSIFVTPKLVERHLGKPGLASTIKAALFGMPLPLCSCGVLPVTASLRKHGAGRGATTSFLVSTPTTGVDSILVAWGMLGPFFALYRAALAVLLGICAGTLADKFGDPDDDGFVEKSEEKPSCCSGHDQSKAVEKPHIVERIRKALTFSFLTLPKDIGRPLMIGIVVAGLIAALIHAGSITPFLGGGIISMLIMLAVGLPLYVCATASVPMALAFIHLGASPGAVLIFLIVGPATNAATIGILWKMIGKRSTIATVATLIIGSLVAGLLLDLGWWYFNIEPISQSSSHVMEHLSIWNSFAAVILLAVQFYSAFRGRVNAWLSKAPAAEKPSCCHGTTEDKPENPAVSKEESGCCGHSQQDIVKDEPACCCHQSTKPENEESCCSGKGGTEGGSVEKDNCCGSVPENKEKPKDGGSCCCGGK